MTTAAKFIRASTGTLALLLVCLFKTVWRWFASPSSYSKPRHQATPTLDEANVFRRHGRMGRINVLPRFGRRHSTQVLVRPQFVVPSAEVNEKRVEGGCVRQSMNRRSP
jgi:hypothetical protein